MAKRQKEESKKTIRRMFLGFLGVLLLCFLTGNVTEAASKKAKVKDAYAKFMLKDSLFKSYDEFALVDLNQDGISELMLCTTSYVNFYRYQGGKVKDVPYKNWHGAPNLSNYSFYPKKHIFKCRSFNSAEHGTIYFKFDGKKLGVQIETTFFYNPEKKSQGVGKWYCWKKNKSITRKQYKKLEKKIKKTAKKKISYKRCTKKNISKLLLKTESKETIDAENVSGNSDDGVKHNAEEDTALKNIANKSDYAKYAWEKGHVAMLTLDGYTGDKLDLGVFSEVGVIKLSSISVKELVIGKNPSLRELSLDECSGFSELNVGGCTALNSLSYIVEYQANLDRLDVSGCSALEEIDLEYINVSSLDLSSCKALRKVLCTPGSTVSDKRLKELKVSGCSELYEIKCAGNQLKTLDLTGCSTLTILDVASNQITELILTGCSNLENCNCSRNQLTKLEISDCGFLKELNCFGNQLTELNLSKCSFLEKLDCCGNQLTELDVSNCSYLEYLDCSGNDIRTLDISRLNNLNRSELSYDRFTELIE